MFYVPDTLSYPRNKLSIKLINRLQEKFKHKKTPIEQTQTVATSKVVVKRFKTVSGEIEHPLKLSTPGKVKRRDRVFLPQISEKKFLLKGKITGKVDERSRSTRKIEVSQPSPRKQIYELKKQKKKTERILEDFFSLRPWQDSKVEQY